MSMPALVGGPYVFNVNNLFYCASSTIKCQTILFQIKEALVALGGAGVIWNVVASCDSSSIKQIGDLDPDLWVDYTDVVMSGAAHSWVILENETTGGQLCLEPDSYNAFFMTALYSPSGTFSNDGTTTARPTDTDAHEIVHNNLDFTTTTSTYINFALHAMTSADHKTTRVFIQEKNSTGSEEGGFTILIEELFNTPSWWISTNKTAILNQSVAVTFSATPNAMSPTLSKLCWSDNFFAFVETSEPYAGWDSFYTTCKCYGITGSASGIPPVKTDVNFGLLGGFPVSPIGCYRPGAVDRGGAIGRFRDLYLATNDHANLLEYPNDATRAWVKIGALLVPWNGTAPLKV